MSTTSRLHGLMALIAVLSIASANVAAEQRDSTDLTGENFTSEELVKALVIPVRGIGSNCASYQRQMVQLTRGLGRMPTTKEEVPSLKPMRTASVTATFAKDSAVLTPAAKANLDKVADALKSSELSTQCFQVAGHTCDLGAQGHNMDLSRRRAEAVKAFLVAKGVDGDRLVTTGFGQTSPLVPNESESSRQKNRRVDLGALPPPGV